MNRYWLAMGHFLGYPKCCREEFASGKLAMKFKRGGFPLQGTGFVPCLYCASSKTPEKLMHEIQTHRIHTVPFPLKAGFSIAEEYRTEFKAFCKNNGYPDVVDMFN